MVFEGVKMDVSGNKIITWWIIETDLLLIDLFVHVHWWLSLKFFFILVHFLSYSITLSIKFTIMHDQTNSSWIACGMEYLLYIPDGIFSCNISMEWNIPVEYSCSIYSCGIFLMECSCFTRSFTSIPLTDTPPIFMKLVEAHLWNSSLYQSQCISFLH